MKTTTIFALILLSTFISYLPSTTAQLVFDSEGEPLQNGGAYYLMPAIWSAGGGIERVKTGQETCPVTVVLSPYETHRGLPIRISSPQYTRFLSLGSGVQMEFASPFQDECAPSPMWTVVEGFPEGPAVKLSGYKSTLDGSFRIQKASPRHNSYKLMFCEQRNRWCGDIGIYRDEQGNRLLVLTKNNPLQVTFVRASSSYA